MVGSEFVVEGVKEPLCIRLCCLSKRHVRQSGRRLSGCLPVSPRASLDALLTCQRRRPFEAKVALAVLVHHTCFCTAFPLDVGRLANRRTLSRSTEQALSADGHCCSSQKCSPAWLDATVLLICMDA